MQSKEGTPQSKEKPQKNVRAWTRMTESDQERLKELATEQGLAPSTYMRLVLIKALDEKWCLRPNP